MNTLLIMTIILLLLIFSAAIAMLWTWFLRNEDEISNKIYDTALKAYNVGKYKKTKVLLKEAVSTYKKNWQAYYLLGLTEIKTKDFENAEVSLEKVVKNDTKNTNAKFWLAYVLQNLNRIDEAEEIYKEILKDMPAHSDSLIQLGLIELERENYEEAQNIFKDAQSVSKKNAACSFYITKCKDKLCKYETEEDGKGIIEEYLRMLDAPDLPETFHITLATAYAKAGQIEDALKFCKKSLERNPECFESYKLLGLIQLLYKDFEGVKNTLATAISLHSENAEVHTLLSYALCQQDRVCEVKKCREKYNEIIQKFVKTKTNPPNNV